jgi:hypothetical protein
VAASAALGVAAEVHPRVRDPGSGDKVARLTAKVAASPGRPVVLFLGSSRTGLAFDALRADDRLDDPCCFNLGLPAAGPVCELLTLNRVLAAGVQPTLVLVEVLPAMLHDSPAGPRERAFLTGDRFSADEARTAERFGYPRDDTTRRWVTARLSPWWTYRFPLWGRVAPSWLAYDVRYDWGRTADAGGWNVPIRDEVTDDEREAGDARARGEYGAPLAVLAPCGGAADALREILATCRSRGITVRLVLLPESTTFRTLYGPGVDDRLVAFLKGLDAPLVDARGWMPDTAFSDGHHLMRPGAVTFTEKLAADVIAPALSRGGRSHD